MKQKWREMILLMLRYLTGILVVGELVYGDLWIGLIFVPVFPAYLIRCKRRKMDEEDFQKMLQFRDAMNSIGASLEAGYSMENAIHAAEKDLACIYAEDSWIRTEMVKIKRSVENAVPMEEALRNFAAHSRLEDAESFAEVYTTARRSGGDLLQIIRSAVSVLSDKVEVKREIHTILTAKLLECRVMRLIPPGILVYFRVFSPGFLNLLYQGLLGRIVMSGLLGFYLFLALLMEKVLKIEV